jgi:hypothetical protein
VPVVVEAPGAPAVSPAGGVVGGAVAPAVVVAAASPVVAVVAVVPVSDLSPQPISAAPIVATMIKPRIFFIFILLS